MFDRGLAYIFAQIGGEGFERANELLMGKVRLDLDVDNEPVFEEDDWKPPVREWDRLVADVENFIRIKVEDLKQVQVEALSSPEELRGVYDITEFGIEMQINSLIAIRDEAKMGLPMAIEHFKTYKETMGRYE